jgi:CheY-like chemotaxis protein
MTHRGEVMIVDDTPANLQLLAGILEDEGYMVRPTRAPQMAIESAQADPPNLILLDIMMPDMDGFEVCRQLKKKSEYSKHSNNIHYCSPRDRR